MHFSLKKRPNWNFFKIKNQIIEAKQYTGPKLILTGLEEDKHCSHWCIYCWLWTNYLLHFVPMCYYKFWGFYLFLDKSSTWLLLLLGKYNFLLINNVWLKYQSVSFHIIKRENEINKLFCLLQWKRYQNKGFFVFLFPADSKTSVLV